MEHNFEKLVQMCQEMAREGLGTEEVIIYLRQQRVTIIESIKVLMRIYGFSINDAKHLLSVHPAWKDVVVAAAPLHEELEQRLSDEINGGKNVTKA